MVDLAGAPQPYIDNQAEVWGERLVAGQPVQHSKTPRTGWWQRQKPPVVVASKPSVRPRLTEQQISQGRARIAEERAARQAQQKHLELWRTFHARETLPKNRVDVAKKLALVVGRRPGGGKQFRDLKKRMIYY